MNICAMMSYFVKYIIFGKIYVNCTRGKRIAYTTIVSLRYNREFVYMRWYSDEDTWTSYTPIHQASQAQKMRKRRTNCVLKKMMCMRACRLPITWLFVECAVNNSHFTQIHMHTMYAYLRCDLWFCFARLSILTSIRSFSQRFTLVSRYKTNTYSACNKPNICQWPK